MYSFEKILHKNYYICERYIYLFYVFYLLCPIIIIHIPILILKCIALSTEISFLASINYVCRFRHICSSSCVSETEISISLTSLKRSRGRSFVQLSRHHAPCSQPTLKCLEFCSTSSFLTLGGLIGSPNPLGFCHPHGRPGSFRFLVSTCPNTKCSGLWSAS